MARGKYVVPVILGQPGRELFYVKGEIPRGLSMVLARKVDERGLTDRDRKQLTRLLGNEGESLPSFDRVKDLELITTHESSLGGEFEATLIHGYVTNTLPGAFRASELNRWYIFERPGELTPLKLARFAINLLDHSERSALIKPLSHLKVDFTHPKFQEYR